MSCICSSVDGQQSRQGCAQCSHSKCPAQTGGAMPSRLLVLCGRPCAGKSTVAQQLQALFIAQGLTVELVDEQSLHLQRDAAYSGKQQPAQTLAHHRQKLTSLLCPISSMCRMPAQPFVLHDHACLHGCRHGEREEYTRATALCFGAATGLSAQWRHHHGQLE